MQATISSMVRDGATVRPARPAWAHWRSVEDRRVWCVDLGWGLGRDEEDQWQPDLMYAVMDDFGNLVRVQ